MKKKFILILVLIVLFGFFGKSIYAQVSQSYKSNKVVTKVGEPEGPEPGQSSPAPGQSSTPTTVASCPIPNGRITGGSYQNDPAQGHCRGNYSYSCNCGADGRRAKSIDVATNGAGGSPVLLPTLDGQRVNWNFVQAACAGGGTYPRCTALNGGTGGLYTFQAQVPGSSDTWTLQFLHMIAPAAISPNASYPSGTEVGRTDISHVHITIGKNVRNALQSGSSVTDCDPGWMPADFMCNKP